jgi:tRNA A-37 threonylcarbamoyl transferase component Bud32
MDGSPLPERYVNVELIGEGGFGRVYRARDNNLARTIAAKVGYQRRDETPDIDGFVSEARTAAELAHENIVAVYDLAFFDEHLYLTMEYAPGGTLDDALASGARFEIDDALRYIDETAAGLNHAHQMGVIHRDVKPSNLLLSSRGVVKVADFGLAREADRSTTHLAGTFAYMAPEQWREGKNLTAATDVFALAVTAYELLTGTRHGGFSSLLDEEDRPPPVSRLLPGVSKDVDVVLARGMALNRNERIADVNEFAADLRQAVERSVGSTHVRERQENRGAAREHTPSPLGPAQTSLFVGTPGAATEIGHSWFLGVKWSGAAKAADAAKAMWVAVVREGVLVDLVPGLDRHRMTDFIDQGRGHSGSALVGIDFGFSVPAWYLESQGIPDAPALWSRMASLQDSRGETTQWPRELDEPFWGPLIRTKPALAPGATWFRATEETARAMTGAVPKSVFQLSGAGSVGGQSVRGMPHLARLRDLGWSIWPFDAPGHYSIVEVFPRALWQALSPTGGHADAQEMRETIIDDLWPEFFAGDRARFETLQSEQAAFEAAFTAWSLWRAGGRLPDLSGDRTAQLEGRIWLPG